jgi:hypothetical protein
MAMQSFGECPWCGARIELRRVERAFACPVCACTFERTRAKWWIAIPVALLVAAPVWSFVPWNGRLLAGLAAIAVLIASSLVSTTRILTQGRTDLTAGEARGHRAGRSRESRWFLVLIGILVLAAIAFVGISLVSMR